MRHNHTRCLPLRQNLVDRIVDTVLACRVQRARRFVQRENRRAFEQCACDCQALSLTPAQTLSTNCKVK